MGDKWCSFHHRNPRDDSQTETGTTYQVDTLGDIGDGDVVTVRVVTAAPDSCTVTSTGVTMTVSAAPIANLNSNATDDTICAGSAVVITADNVPGATYTFRLNGLAVPPGDVVGRVYTTSAITHE